MNFEKIVQSSFYSEHFLVAVYIFLDQFVKIIQVSLMLGLHTFLFLDFNDVMYNKLSGGV